MDKTPDPRQTAAGRFREEFIRAAGEEPLWQTVAAWLKDGAPERGVSGLLVLTPLALHFIELPADSWLVSTVRQREQRRNPAGEAPPLRERFALADLRSAKRIRRPWPERLFGDGLQHWSLGLAGGRQERFALPRGAGLSARLSAFAASVPDEPQ
jgi:hypothetical protein